MRIIAGKFKGRKLVDCSKLKSLRPTTDRNREAIFNILSSAKFLRDENFSLSNCVFLDLCCGTGAVGIEAISRGAKKVVFIDNNDAHLAILSQNIKTLSSDIEYKIIKQNIFHLKDNIDGFDLIFLDPPYNENYEKIIKNLLEKNYLHNNIKNSSTILVVELRAEDVKKYQDFIEKNFIILDQRLYGKSFFGFYKIRYNQIDISKKY